MPTESAPVVMPDIFAPLTEAQLKAIQKAQTHWSYKAGLTTAVIGGIIGIGESVNFILSSSPHPIHSVLLAGGTISALIGQGLMIYSADKNKPLSRRYED